jgi:hypothetical protein
LVVAGRVVEAEFCFVALCAVACFAGAACFLSCAGLLLFGADGLDVFAPNGFVLDIFVPAVFAPDGFAANGFVPAGFASDTGLASGLGVADGATVSPLAVSAVSLPEAISKTTWLS